MAVQLSSDEAISTPQVISVVVMIARSFGQFWADFELSLGYNMISDGC